MALLRISERLDDGDTPAAATLTLPFELRQKSRLRARLDDGTEVGLFLTRGTLLRRFIAAMITAMNLRSSLLFIRRI